MAFNANVTEKDFTRTNLAEILSKVFLGYQSSLHN